MPPYGPPVYPRQDHPKANTAMVLGIVALAGGALCYLPILVAPFAWAIGRRTVQEIDASQGYLGGRSTAHAGYVLGVVGSILFAVGTLGFLAYLFFVLAIVDYM